MAPDPRASRWLIVLAGFLAYAAALGAPFCFDDGGAIVQNPHLESLWPPSGTVRPPAPRSTLDGRPVLAYSLALNRALFGEGPAGFRAVNLGIHLLAGLLLHGLLRRLLPGNPWAALLGALAWTLHPVQTASVTYVVQRAESLSGGLYLGALYALVRGWGSAAVACSALGMATKEGTVTLPVVALVMDRCLLAGSFREALRLRGRLHAGLAATWAVLVLCLISGEMASPTAARRGILDTALLQLDVCGHYLTLAVLPLRLVFDYGPGGWAEVPGRAAAVALLGLLTCILLWRRPRVGFLGFWWFGLLAPGSLAGGLVDPAFEHRMYLALAAPAALAGLALARRPALGLAVVCALGGLTVARNLDYRSGPLLWGDAVRKGPRNYRAREFLANGWEEAGRTRAAVQEYRRSVALAPGRFIPRYRLGFLLGRLGDVAGAREHLERAVLLSPWRPQAWHALGVTRHLQGDREGARAAFEQALALDPLDEDARRALSLLEPGS